MNSHKSLKRGGDSEREEDYDNPFKPPEKPNKQFSGRDASSPDVLDEYDDGEKHRREGKKEKKKKDKDKKKKKKNKSKKKK